MKMANSTARTKFNKRVMAITLILTVIFLAMFVFGMYCLLSSTVPKVGFISVKFMKEFIGYCVYRGLTNAATCLAIFIFYFRSHNIDDLVTQTGAYEFRWLGFAFVGIWVVNVILKFLIPDFLMPPHGLLFLGVLNIILYRLDKELANRVDMYFNSEGGNRRLGDMGPLQFMDFVAHLFRIK